MSTKAVMLPRALYRWGLAREHVDYSFPGRLVRPDFCRPRLRGSVRQVTDLHGHSGVRERGVRNVSVCAARRQRIEQAKPMCEPDGLEEPGFGKLIGWAGQCTFV